MAALSAAGVAMGTDVLQAGIANTSVIGTNSLLMVRSTIQNKAVTTSEAAVRYVATHLGGVP